MDKIVTATPPRIAQGAICPHAILKLSELKEHLHLLQSFGTWRKGFQGHYSLPLYFNDGKTGPSRSTLVQLSAFSKYGLGFYTEESGGQVKEEEKPKGKKPRTKPATISLDYDTSPDVRMLDALLNPAVTVIMQGQISQLKKTFTAEDDTKVVQRKAAKRSSGAVQKSLRVTCYPGRTQLENDSDVKVSMANFPKEEGDYNLVIDLASIDASMDNGIITYGLVIYGRAIKPSKKVERQPLAWREESEEEGEGKEKEELPDEAEILKNLKKIKRESTQAKKQEKKEKTKKRKDAPEKEENE